MRKRVAQTWIGCLAAAGLLLGCSSPRQSSPDPAQGAQESPQAAQLLAEGVEAPDIEAEAHDGSMIRLRELRGQPVVLYFYPKDETPG